MAALSRKVRIVILVVMGLPLLLVAGLISAITWWAIPPSTDALKKQFHSKRSELEALVQLMKADGHDGFCLRGAGLAEMQALLPPERFEEYQSRMRRAEVQCVFRRGEAKIEIPVWSFGFPGTDTSRGFVWSLESLPNEFACISAASCFPQDLKLKRWERVHERIAPEWALYAF